MGSIAFINRWSLAMSQIGLLALLPVVAGCNVGQAKVSGKVLYNGVPLPGAQILFRPADATQNAVIARADADGRYEALLPVGEVKVSVDNRDQAPHSKGPGRAPPGLPPEVYQKLKGNGQPEAAAPKSGDNNPDKPAVKYIPIPPNYFDIETSGLGFRVEGGGGIQEHDLELKGASKK
jgi:hypothetical protein